MPPVAVVSQLTQEAKVRIAMNIHIELNDPQKCEGCPLLDTPPLWQGRPTAPPECKLGYDPQWKKNVATEALVPTQGYAVIRAQGCIEVNGE